MTKKEKVLLNASVPRKSDYAVFTPLCFMELAAQSFIGLVSLDHTRGVGFCFGCGSKRKKGKTNRLKISEFGKKKNYIQLVKPNQLQISNL